MRQLYVIGDPVAHSLSPLIHRAMIRQTGAAYCYDVRTVRPGELAVFMAWAKGGGCAGCNVTMPLKEAIVPLLDEVDNGAAACGAVNTVCFREGRAIGHNTDGAGFLDSLAGNGFDPQGQRVLLLGAGGAATAVCHALAQAGAARIAVCDRSIGRAETLAARYPGRAVAGGLDELVRYAAESRLVVNATSLGMAGCAAFGDLSFLRAAPEGAVVYDLVYHPRRTALLEAASGLGLRTMGGIDLLIRQAVRAFVLFTGEKPDTEALYTVLREPLGLK